MNATKTHEVAVYDQQCVMAGRVCVNPEAKFGDDWRDSHDLMVLSGTVEEMRECAKASGFMGRAWAAALAYVD